MTDRIGQLKVGRAVTISFKDVRVGAIGAYYESDRQSKSTNYADSPIKYTPNVSNYLCDVGNLVLRNLYDELGGLMPHFAGFCRLFSLSL